MNINRRAFNLALGTTALSAGMSVPAFAETVKLTMASSHPTAIAWVGALEKVVVPKSNEMLKAMGSDTTIDWTESYGGALYKFDKTLEAVTDGLTDLGWVGTLWEESKMPLQNVTYYTPMVSDDLLGMLDLFNKLHEEMPALSEAWDKQNTVLLGVSGIETYQLLTREPFTGVDDLKGKKIISAGSVGNWLKGTGAAPVNAGLPQFYNLLKTGVADGVLISFSGAFPFKLHEVAPYMTKVNLGAQMTGGMAINKDKWNRLGDDVKQVLRKLGTEYSNWHANVLMDIAGKFEATMVEQGATSTTMEQSERAKWVNTMPDIAAEWRDATGGAAGEVLQTYLAGMKELGYEAPRAWGS